MVNKKSKILPPSLLLTDKVSLLHKNNNNNTCDGNTFTVQSTKYCFGNRHSKQLTDSDNNIDAKSECDNDEAQKHTIKVQV